MVTITLTKTFVWSDDEAANLTDQDLINSAIEQASQDHEWTDDQITIKRRRSPGPEQEPTDKQTDHCKCECNECGL